MTQSGLKTKDLDTTIKVLNDVQSELMLKHWEENGYYDHEDPTVISLYEARLVLERVREGRAER